MKGLNCQHFAASSIIAESKEAGCSKHKFYVDVAMMYTSALMSTFRARAKLCCAHPASNYIHRDSSPGVAFRDHVVCSGA